MGKHSIFNQEGYDENDCDAPYLDLEDDEEVKRPEKPQEGTNLFFVGQGNNPRLARDALL